MGFLTDCQAIFYKIKVYYQMREQMEIKAFLNENYDNFKKELEKKINDYESRKITTDVSELKDFNLEIIALWTNGKPDEFLKIISEVEKTINIKKAEKFLQEKEKKIKELGRPDSDFNAFFITKTLEVYMEKENHFPVGKELNKIIKTIAENGLPEFSKKVMKTRHKNSERMLSSQRAELEQIEDRRCMRWKEPLDLLECLIKVSHEAGEELKNKFGKSVSYENSFKIETLIRIHARALQISNEILVLLKAGYPDGANARWRSLHELAVISFFLKDNDDEVSRRYLEHEIVRKFKDAKDYRNYCKRLGYPPMERTEFNELKREKERLCVKYDDKFQEKYGWIPRRVLKDRNFRALEEYVKLDKLHPFYNLSYDSVHGGAKGFYRLGLMDDYQNKVLLVGPSNYGLADPMQNTAISLSHITICLLNLIPDFESIFHMQIIHKYVKEIGEKAVNVQEDIEKEECSRPFIETKR